MNEEARYLEKHCPNLARSCDEMAEAGAALHQAKEGIYHAKAPASPAESITPGALSCAGCGGVKPLNYTVRIEGSAIFGICDDCDDGGAQVKRALLYAVCAGMGFQAASYSSDRHVLAEEIARLKESLRIGTETRIGITEQWDKSRSAAAREIERLKQACRRQFRWNLALGIALALAVIWIVVWLGRI